MKVTSHRAFASSAARPNVVPFRKRLGLMGLADAAADQAMAEFGTGADANVIPSDIANQVMAGNSNYYLPGESYGVPTRSPEVDPMSAQTAALIASLATTAANAYTQTQQAQVGIAPPGYTYRGYASNITSGYGNLAPPGYSNAGLYANGYPYYGTGGYQYNAPAVASSSITPNTLLLIGGIAIIAMMAGDHDKKR